MNVTRDEVSKFGTVLMRELVNGSLSDKSFGDIGQDVINQLDPSEYEAALRVYLPMAARALDSDVKENPALLILGMLSEDVVESARQTVLQEEDHGTIELNL